MQPAVLISFSILCYIYIYIFKFLLNYNSVTEFMKNILKGFFFIIIVKSTSHSTIIVGQYYNIA